MRKRIAFYLSSYILLVLFVVFIDNFLCYSCSLPLRFVSCACNLISWAPAKRHKKEEIIEIIFIVHRGNCINNWTVAKYQLTGWFHCFHRNCSLEICFSMFCVASAWKFDKNHKNIRIFWNAVISLKLISPCDCPSLALWYFFLTSHGQIQPLDEWCYQWRAVVCIIKSPISDHRSLQRFSFFFLNHSTAMVIEI